MNILQNLLYICINSHCPIAASACFSLIFVGFSFNFNFPTPTPTAPDVTKVTSFPELTISDKTLVNFSIRPKLICPFA